jgi:hypothetical protein
LVARPKSSVEVVKAIKFGGLSFEEAGDGKHIFIEAGGDSEKLTREDWDFIVSEVSYGFNWSREQEDAAVVS